MILGLALKRRPAALLLDAGDTLIFFDAPAVSLELRARGIELAPERLDAAMHGAKRAYQARLASGHRHEDGWNVLMHELLTTAGASSSDVETVLPALRRVHDDFYFWRKVPPELLDALEQARAAGLRLAVISNSEGRLRYVLDRLGLLSAFELVIDSHLEGVQKPDPEIFQRALARLELSAERSVYAGDIPEIDVRGAERVGMHGVLVDALDLYADRTDVPRVRSVAELVRELLLLPA